MVDVTSLINLFLNLCQVVNEVFWPRLARWMRWKSAPTSPNELLDAVHECKGELNDFQEELARIANGLDGSDGLCDTIRQCKQSVVDIKDFLNKESHQHGLQHTIIDGITAGLRSPNSRHSLHDLLTGLEQSLAKIQDIVDKLPTRINDMCKSLTSKDSEHDPTLGLHRGITTVLCADAPPGTLRDQPVPPET